MRPFAVIECAMGAFFGVNIPEKMKHRPTVPGIAGRCIARGFAWVGRFAPA